MSTITLLTQLQLDLFNSVPLHKSVFVCDAVLATNWEDYQPGFWPDEFGVLDAPWYLPSGSTRTRLHGVCLYVDGFASSGRF